MPVIDVRNVNWGCVLDWLKQYYESVDWTLFLNFGCFESTKCFFLCFAVTSIALIWKMFRNIGISTVILESNRVTDQIIIIIIVKMFKIIIIYHFINRVIIIIIMNFWKKHPKISFILCFYDNLCTTIYSNKFFGF